MSVFNRISDSVISAARAVPNPLKSRVSRDLALALPFSVIAASAHAEAWDYSSLTSAIDFDSIGTAVLAVAALLAAVYAGIKGAKIVIGFLRS